MDEFCAAVPNQKYPVARNQKHLTTVVKRQNLDVLVAYRRFAVKFRDKLAAALAVVAFYEFNLASPKQGVNFVSL